MIEFSHVSKLFGAQKAVNDLNLNFQEGSFSVLIGTSGSGKSTTLKMINRLVEHDSGEIRFAGEEIRSLPVLELRRRMGYAIQSIGLFPHWSVAQNIATVPQLQKWSRARIDDRIDELMTLLGLESNLRERYPHQLSGGQQQRVGVARALAADPQDGPRPLCPHPRRERGAAGGCGPRCSQLPGVPVLTGPRRTVRAEKRPVRNPYANEKTPLPACARQGCFFGVSAPGYFALAALAATALSSSMMKSASTFM